MCHDELPVGIKFEVVPGFSQKNSVQAGFGFLRFGRVRLGWVIKTQIGVGFGPVGFRKTLDPHTSRSGPKTFLTLLN